jgi:hypothetical protein
MEKSIRQELETLSLEAFGNKNYYRKYMERGVPVREQAGPPYMLKLSVDGVRHYMLKYIEGRLKMSKELNKQEE